MKRTLSFWTDPLTARLTREAKLLLRWAWDVADEDGRLQLSIHRIRTEVFAREAETGLVSDEMMEDLVEEIRNAGRWIIWRETLGEGESRVGVEIVQLRSFRRFQASVGKRTASDLPPPPDVILERYVRLFGLLDVETTKREVSDREAGLREAARRVFDRWVAETDRDATRTQFTPERFSLVVKRLREGVTEEQIMAAIRGVQANGFMMGTKGDRKGHPALNDLTDICKSTSRVEKWASGAEVDATDELDDLRQQTLARNKAASGRALPKRPAPTGGRRARQAQ